MNISELLCIILAGKQVAPSSNGHDSNGLTSGRDDSFREFRRLCADIAEENSYTGKTAIVTKFITKGTSGGNFNYTTPLAMIGNIDT